MKKPLLYITIMISGDIIERDNSKYMCLSDWDDGYIVICPITEEKPRGVYELASPDGTLIVWASHSIAEEEVKDLPKVESLPNLAKEGWKIFRSWMLGDDVEDSLKHRLGEPIDEQGAKAHRAYQEQLTKKCSWITESWAL